ncbi:MAG TPA: 4-hydroxy-tetrahydrodipicolinate reductase, partial [Chitinophagaceae bacterium]
MKLALIGYGKMGKAIEEVALHRSHQVILRIDQPNLYEFTKENLSKADVAIEFTGPQSAFENVKKCLEFGVPVVCGSTGWTERIDEI